ncbi:MAG: sel1 repeat family protein [Deltaproteobacteria bacterium]|nr:sel1 repeat family protein [Deltaproteobacteria bacterium]
MRNARGSFRSVLVFLVAVAAGSGCRPPAPDTGGPGPVVESPVQPSPDEGTLPPGEAGAAESGEAASEDTYTSDLETQYFDAYPPPEDECRPASEALPPRDDPSIGRPLPPPCGSEADCRRECDQGTLAACVELSYLSYDRGQAAAADEPLRTLCDAGDPVACRALARFLWSCTAEGCPARDSAASEAAQRACDLGDARGCTEVADFSAADSPFASVRAWWQKGCDAGDASGCLFIVEQIWGPWGSAPTVEDLLRRACALDDVRGCWHLGVFLDLEARPDEARAAFREACERLGGHDACRAWGRLATGTDDSPPEDREAALRASCLHGEQSDCDVLVELLGEGPEAAAEVEDLARRSCETGHRTGCLYLGSLLSQARRFDEAESRLRPMCEGPAGDECDREAMGAACFLLGHLLSQSDRPDEAAAAWARGCRHGSRLCCEPNEVDTP